jgi:hypothetical protein
MSKFVASSKMEIAGAEAFSCDQPNQCELRNFIGDDKSLG